MNIDEFLDNAVVEDSLDDFIDLTDVEIEDDLFPASGTAVMNEMIKEQEEPKMTGNFVPGSNGTSQIIIMPQAGVSAGLPQAAAQVPIKEKIVTKKVLTFQERLEKFKQKYLKFLSSGDLINALKLYTSFLEYYKGMDSKDSYRDVLLNRALLEFHKEYKKTLLATSKEYQKGENNTKLELQEGYKKVENNDIKGATNSYKKVLSIYRKMPNAFAAKRRVIQSHIIHFNLKISALRKDLLSKDFAAKKRKIITDLNAVDSLLNKKEFKSALSLLDQVEKGYNKLSNDLLEEKALLLEHILARRDSVLIALQIKNLQTEYLKVRKDDRVFVKTEIQKKKAIPKKIEEKKNLPKLPAVIVKKELPKNVITPAQAKKILSKEKVENPVLPKSPEVLNEKVVVKDTLSIKVTDSLKAAKINSIRVDVMHHRYSAAKSKINSLLDNFSDDKKVIEICEKYTNYILKAEKKLESASIKVKKPTKTKTKKATLRKLSAVKSTNPSTTTGSSNDILSKVQATAPYIRKKLALTKYHINKGHTQKAKEIIDSVLKVDPDNEDAKKLLKRIEK